MRVVSAIWILLRRLPRPLLSVTLLGWAFMVWSKMVPTTPDLCLRGTFAQALTARAEAAVAGVT